MTEVSSARLGVASRSPSVSRVSLMVVRPSFRARSYGAAGGPLRCRYVISPLALFLDWPFQKRYRVSMGRPKEFDPDVALERAMELFWEKGFQGTSMQELVDRMGINRGSLYTTFGSKEELFQATMDRYCEQRTAALIDVLSGEGDPTTIVRGVFEGAIAEVEAKVARGCFATNASVELGPHCSRTAEKLTANRERMEEAFFQLLKRHQGLRNKPRATARFLVSMLCGLSVTQRVAPKPQELRDIVDVALSVLD